MASYAAVIEGLEILAKHEPKGRQAHGVAAEHDVIYAGTGVDFEQNLPREARERLMALGWHWDAEVKSWARFV